MSINDCIVRIHLDIKVWTHIWEVIYVQRKQQRRKDRTLRDTNSRSAEGRFDPVDSYTLSSV